MEAHNRKPLYYRSTNPNVPQVGEVTVTLFQWDETLQMPVEVQNSISAMPPEDIVGDYILWSDTYTLGYTSELDAAPIFFTNGAVGDDKIISVINHVANRLGLGQTYFTDLATAKAWAAAEVRIYVEDDTVNAPVVCDPNVTNAYGGGTGPGNLRTSLAVIPRVADRFNGPDITPFNTQRSTVTKACILEQLQAAYDDGAGNGISSVGWSDITTDPNSYHAFTTNLEWNAIPAIGDVIYRDDDGNEYFGTGGFLYQDTSYSSTANANAFKWITVGANGVVTNVESLGYLSGN